MKLVFVHGACIRDGAWWWSRMVAPLANLGLTTATVDLPSSSGTGDLYGDSDAVRAVLDELDEPVILCGHSYGGRVVADVSASHPAVERVVYIATVAPTGDGPPSFLSVEHGAVVVNNTEVLAELMFHDCADAFDEAVKRIAKASVAAMGQQPRGTVQVPSTYVVCADDRAAPPDRQRANAASATKVVEIPTGHHPHLAQPAALATLIASP